MIETYIWEFPVQVPVTFRMLICQFLDSLQSKLALVCSLLLASSTRMFEVWSICLMKPNPLPVQPRSIQKISKASKYALYFLFFPFLGFCGGGCKNEKSKMIKIKVKIKVFFLFVVTAENSMECVIGRRYEPQAVDYLRMYARYVRRCLVLSVTSGFLTSVAFVPRVTCRKGMRPSFRSN